MSVGFVQNRDLIQEENQHLITDRDDNNQQPPHDRGGLAYIAFLIFGLAALLPWNMFITATAYFDKKFEGGKPFVHSKFENFFTVFSQITNVAFLFINVHLQSRFSAFARIMTSLGMMFVMFVLTTVMVKVNTSSWPDEFFAMTLVTIVLFNACSGVFQGGIFGIAATFTPKHIQGFMSGQGMGGIFASMASIISLAVTQGKDPLGSGFYYFLSASIVIALSLAVYPAFLKLDISKFYLDRVTDDFSRSFIPSNVPAYETVKQIKWMLFSVWITFTITLSVFPSITANIRSFDGTTPLTGTYWTPVTCFLLFNFGDYIGRTAAGFVQCVNRKWLVILSVSRIVFIPLFILCNYLPEERTVGVLFDNDCWPIAFMTIFSLTNGYFASLAMMYGPGLVPSGPQQSTAGAFMAFGLGFGLMCGAFCSFAVLAVV